MEVIYLPKARHELESAITSYNQQRPGLGEVFAAAVDATVEYIVQFPHGWTRLAGRIRQCRIDRFPFCGDLQLR